MNLPLDNSPASVSDLDSTGAPLADLVVAQRQYGFARVGRHAGIVTGDVTTCSGLVAIDSDQGLVFMMHADIPWHDGSAAAALKELRRRCPGPLSKVKVYDLAGITPCQVVVATFVVGTLFHVAYHWLGGVDIALLALVLPVCFLSTRARLYLTLRRLGFNWPKMLTRVMAEETGEPAAKCGANVRIPLVGSDRFKPQVTKSCSVREDRFQVPKTPARSLKQWWLNRVQLTRAQGSIGENE